MALPQARRASRGARQLRAVPILLGVAVVGIRQGSPSTFFGAPRPPLRRPCVGASATRTAAEEQSVDDKLDGVLRRKLERKGEQDEDADEVSPWTKRAIEAATAKLPAEKARKAQAEKMAKKRKKQAKEAAENTDIVKGEDKERGKIVRKTLDEVLKSASDDDDRPSYLPAKRDIYKEVGITQAEVDAYWDRREESSQSFVDRFLFLGYIGTFFVVCAFGFSVYDSTVNPQETTLASMTGTE